jgi:hypothetical protein
MCPLKKNRNEKENPWLLELALLCHGYGPGLRAGQCTLLAEFKRVSVRAHALTALAGRCSERGTSYTATPT